MSVCEQFGTWVVAGGAVRRDGDSAVPRVAVGGISNAINVMYRAPEISITSVSEI
jgi:hypothetical protein